MSDWMIAYYSIAIGQALRFMFETGQELLGDAMKETADAAKVLSPAVVALILTVTTIIIAPLLIALSVISGLLWPALLIETLWCWAKPDN